MNRWSLMGIVLAAELYASVVLHDKDLTGAAFLVLLIVCFSPMENGRG
jgi:hypothetical protein